MHRRTQKSLLFGLVALSSVSQLAFAAPQVQSFSCAPGIVDARSNDVTVTCALRVIDKVADIDYAYTRIYSPSGKHSLPLYFDGKKSFGLTGYSGANLAATFTVPRHAEPGYWQVDFLNEGLRVVNQKGESVLLSQTDAQAGGFNQIVKVYSPDDLAPPYIKDVVCTNPLNENNARLDAVPISCQFTLTDSGSGPAMVRAAFADPEGDEIIFIAADATRNAVTTADGDIVVTATAPAYPGMQPGRWLMVNVAPYAPYVEDKNLNGFSYEGVDVTTLWTQAWFDVTSVPDVTPPVIQKFGCSATQVVVPYAGQDSYGCQLVVQDDLSGFAYGEMVLESPDRNKTVTLRFDGNTRQVQFARGGIFTPTLNFDPTAQGGMWTVSAAGLMLRDLVGNTVNVSPKELNDRSYPSFVLITKTDVPPAVVKSPASSLRTSYTTLIIASVLSLLALRR